MLYFSLDQLLSKLDDPYQSRCRDFYEEHQRLFITSKGSKIKHQAWKGGYLGHVTEIMNIACVMYDALNQCRALPFSLSDALLCLYLHDIEKLWVHAWEAEDRNDNPDKDLFLSKFGLTKQHLNAIKYAHGEGDDYHPIQRVQGPLAAFVHHCDNTSARIWFAHPKGPGWN